MNDSTYKRASVTIVGAVGLLFLVSYFGQRILWSSIDYVDYSQYQRWLGPLSSLFIPILAAWVGMLIRRARPRPGLWVTCLLPAIIPATYIYWTMFPSNEIFFSWTGVRCQVLYSGILGFLIPLEQLEAAGKDKGWIPLILFLGCVFIYVGVCSVTNHFAVSSFQLPKSEGTWFFVRAMRFIPLTMGIYFLALFSFSATGQTVGGVKAVGIAVQAVAVIMFIVYITDLIFRWYYFPSLYQIYCILVQPVSIFLVTAIIRKLMSGLRSKERVRDIFIVDNPTQSSCVYNSGEGAEEKAFGPGPESSLEDINNCG